MPPPPGLTLYFFETEDFSAWTNLKIKIYELLCYNIMTKSYKVLHQKFQPQNEFQSLLKLITDDLSLVLF